ncbi:MAG: hypothetical protein IPK96_16145 [Flammeovirgaceae bacterium]|jgi:ABC-type multidrug transport system fused ATPase/permease subunit|nr:hypothetical protein [Flammeovirgaceae bacterium]
MERSVWVGKILMFAMVALLIAFGVVIGTMYLWNWVIPEVFNGPIINFWQTLGLLALSKIFFWNFGGRCNRHSGHSGGPWRPYWKEKLSTMSPEDRERFKQKMKEKWCYTGADKSSEGSGSANG